MKKAVLLYFSLLFCFVYAQSPSKKDTLGDHYASEAMMNFFFGKYDLSIANAGKAIKQNPKNAKAYHYRGRSYTVLKKFTEGLNDLNKAIQLDETDANNYYARGLFYWVTQKYPKAIGDMTSCLNIDSSYREALLMRGEIKMESNDLKGALADLKKYTVRYPKERDGFYQLGNAYHKLKQQSEACDCWRNARKMGHKKVNDLIANNCPLEEADTSSYLMRDYKEKLQVTPSTASSVTKNENTMESKILYFYASRMRGDDKWKEVLPADGNYSGKLKYGLEKYDKWKFLEVKLKAKQKVNNYTWWVKIYMKIEINGKIDDGDDEVEIKFTPDGKWTIVAVPT